MREMRERRWNEKDNSLHRNRRGWWWCGECRLGLLWRLWKIWRVERDEEEFLKRSGTIDIARDQNSKKCTETTREGVGSREKERALAWLRVI